MNTKNLYEEYKAKMQKIADVKYGAAVLQWDQETYLPENGADRRGAQISTLTEIAHQLFTDEKTGILLNQLIDKEDLSENEKSNIKLSLEDYSRNKKLSSDFVRKMSEAIHKGYHNWARAKKENSFEIFENSLSEIVDFKKQEADLLGYQHHPYNALMNDYDKGLTVQITDVIFDNLKPELIKLLDKIKNKPQPNNDFLYKKYDKTKQWNFGIELLKQIGFDFNSGRQDISLHPFTTNFNSRDVRVTTRIDEQYLGNMTWSCLHEGGHALYEQGLPDNEYGLPLSEYCSLSIHESQSRLWENAIGRGSNFWQHNFSLLKAFFPKQLSEIDVDTFYKGINKVTPSLIRTEADEITYHFHVIIRYEIEKLLIEGSLKTKDIPAYWNEMYKKYLGVVVPDDATGCLQDIHWSHGSFGYFATYSLGSLYASQFYATINQQIPDVEESVRQGNTAPILKWLRSNIHQYGRKYNSEELCKKITGETLNTKHFITYATKKLDTIYS